MEDRLTKEAPAPGSDDRQAQLVRWVDEHETATLDARHESERARDYYDGYQWTPEEREVLARRKQPAITVNRIKPKIDALRGLERQTQTVPKCYPRRPGANSTADAATDALRYVCDDANFGSTRAVAWRSLLIEGSCAAKVYVERDNPEKVRVVSIPWDRMIFDPYSRALDFSDARWLGEVIWLDYDIARRTYPEGHEALEASFAAGDGIGQTFEDRPLHIWSDGKRRRVKVVELWYRDDDTVRYACFTRGGMLKPEQESPYIGDDGKREWIYSFHSAFIDRELNRYGHVRQLLDIQDEINRRRSKALHLLSVRQIKADRGAVEDINKARAEAAKADGYFEVAPNALFELLPTGDMASAQFSLLAEAKAEMDAVGANAAVTGKEDRVMSGRALLARQQSGQAEVGPLYDALRDWQITAYRMIWNRVRQYWKKERWVRITDDERTLKWVGLNQDMTRGDVLLEQARQQGVPPEQLEQARQRMQQDPAMQVVVERRNVVADMDIDIVVDEMPDVANLQQEQFQVLGEMVRGGAIPMSQAVAEALIEASQIRNKDKIIKALRGDEDIPPQVRVQMQQMGQQMEAMQRALQEAAQGKQEAETQVLKGQADVEIKRLEIDLKHGDQAIKRAEVEIKREELAMKRMELEAPLVKVVEGQYSMLAAQLEALLQLQRQMLMAATAPKEIVVQRGPDGRLAGAVATPVVGQRIQ